MSGLKQKSVDAIATIHVKKPKMCNECLRNTSLYTKSTI